MKLRHRMNELEENYQKLVTCNTDLQREVTELRVLIEAYNQMGTRKAERGFYKNVFELGKNHRS